MAKKPAFAPGDDKAPKKKPAKKGGKAAPKGQWSKISDSMLANC